MYLPNYPVSCWFSSVLFSGDSFAEALQVPMEDTFWAILEREIKECTAVAGREPEVNFGVSGYGTAQELITQ